MARPDQQLQDSIAYNHSVLILHKPGTVGGQNTIYSDKTNVPLEYYSVVLTVTNPFDGGLMTS